MKPLESPAEAAPSSARPASPIRVLFVCTHNSARSIMAEASLRHHGGDTFEAHSMGTEPGEVRPLTLRVLADAGLPTEGLRSKSLDEFMGQRFDYVVTVCDSAREQCPVFPGEGERLHWGYDDPSTASGNYEQRSAEYRRVLDAIDERIMSFVATFVATEERTGDRGSR